MAQIFTPSETAKERFQREIASQIGGGLGRGLSNSFASHLNERREDEALQRLTGKDLSGLGRDMKRSFSERLAKSPEHERIKEALVSQGVDESDAELYTLLTTGGQTAYVKELLEKKKRQGKVPGEFGELSEEGRNWEEELSDIVSHQDEGLTPSERVARGKERFASGQKVRGEAVSKLRGFARDKERFDILESLNKKGKLPEDFARLNVDSDGNLRFPFASSPDAERYVKVLNEFSSNAKDTYGSRVTNFDLAQYLKRFPTLLNSKEGRRQILDQMKIVNDINSVYYKNLDNVYRKAGGARAIDSDQAEDIASRMSEDKINQLAKKFEKVGEFQSMPSASEFAGRKIRDKETGQILQSNGQDWVPVSDNQME